MLTRSLSEQKRTTDINVQHLLPLIELVVFRRSTTSNPGIRNHDVDFAEILDDLVKGLDDLVFVRGVTFIAEEFWFGEAGALGFIL